MRFGMRFGMRLGRRSWITGGGGVFAASCLFDLVIGMLVLTLHAVRLSCMLALRLGLLGANLHTAYRLRQTFVARRSVEVSESLRGSVSSSVAQNAIRGRVRVWGVYVVGNEFHHGVFPTKEAQLVQLYPGHAKEVFQIALFPDATRARQLAAHLKRRGFSLQELQEIKQYVATRAGGRAPQTPP